VIVSTISKRTPKAAKELICGVGIFRRGKTKFLYDIRFQNRPWKGEDGVAKSKQKLAK
jgi:hypothetical protein